MPPHPDIPSAAPPIPDRPLRADRAASPEEEQVVERTAVAVPDGLPTEGTGARVRRRKRRKVGRIVFGVSLVVLLVCVPVLGYVGYHAVYNSTGGRKINLPTDPTKAGFEATVAPTPTALFVVTDAAGALSGAAIASLTTDQGGAVIGGNLMLLPVGTLAPAPPDPDAQTLAHAWTTGGKDAVDHGATVLFGLAFDEVVVIDHDRWADLVAPVAPITIDNPDRITEPATNGKTKTVFAAGKLDLTAAQIGTYFDARSPGESELSRLARQQRLWDAWLAKVRAAPDPFTAVPGEVDSGIGRYVRVLSAGRLGLYQLPVQPPVEADAGTAKEAFTADEAATARLVATIVPYPTGGPDGGRVRVRILDGVGQRGVTLLVAPLLVPEGAEITISGNADRFTYDKTQIVYYDDGFKEAAERFRQALGAGEVVQSSVLNDSNDVTVVIGRDFVGNGTATTVTTGGSSD